MNEVSAWVLSIVGICVLSVLFDLFMPDGETNSHIKNVINFAIILVIIMPLPGLLRKDVNVEDFLQEGEVIIQEDFIYQLNRDRLTELEETIESELEKNGIAQVGIIISADIFDEKMEIDAVFVDLKNLVILEKDKHIDIEKEVIRCVQSHIKLEKEKIFFNEQ